MRRETAGQQERVWQSWPQCGPWGRALLTAQPTGPWGKGVVKAPRGMAGFCSEDPGGEQGELWGWDVFRQDQYRGFQASSVMVTVIHPGVCPWVNLQGKLCPQRSQWEASWRLVGWEGAQAWLDPAPGISRTPDSPRRRQDGTGVVGLGSLCVDTGTCPVILVVTKSWMCHERLWHFLDNVGLGHW